MHLSGQWHLCDDGVERPVIHGEVLAGEGSWLPLPFLVDTGADRTVLSADTLAALNLPMSPAGDSLAGLGGTVHPVSVETTIRLFRDEGGEATFRGQFAAVMDPEALDMSVLGRDVTGLFAVIVDRPGNAVCLVRERHRYAILQG
jgi:hypothetical protein